MIILFINNLFESNLSIFTTLKEYYNIELSYRNVNFILQFDKKIRQTNDEFRISSLTN